MRPATIYEVYSEELKRALISDNIKVLRVYGDDGKHVKFVRCDNDEDVKGEENEDRN